MTGMRTLTILKNLLLTLLLTVAASGAVNAKLASGPQNLGPDLHQAASWLEAAPRLGWSSSSYDGASESPVVTRGAAKASDGLGSLLNSSKFDRLLSSKGRAIQFQNQGNARNAFDQLRRDLGVSADDVVQRPGGVTTFRSGNRTFTLRSDSAGGNTVSVVTDNNPQQIVIRFGQE